MTTTLLGQPDPRDVELDALRIEVELLRAELVRLRSRSGLLHDMELRERGWLP